MEAGEAFPDSDEAVRFEDLTVDDDLPILERIVRYTRSQIALQRLVHVKMLGETAELAGILDTQHVIIPLLNGLVSDPESVIRQHLAAQLLTISIICMLDPSNRPPPGSGAPVGGTQYNNYDGGRQMIVAKAWVDHPEWPKIYDPTGYRVVKQVIVGQLLAQLISDIDVDVRRAAADSLTGLALQIQVQDIPTLILPIPLHLAAAHKAPTGAAAVAAAAQQKKSEAEQQSEELRMTAANLLAELGGAVAEHEHIQPHVVSWGTSQLVPAILEFTRDISSFRVRRAAAQALPRILGACLPDAVISQILPAFETLSKDELYRVRKSTGECLVDMSRSLVILASMNNANKKRLLEARRSTLIPIADRLIQDEHKMVRQGMMQFLGPFMASFYPFFSSPLHELLPATSESDGSNHLGIVAQFFPHATSMVSRLNSSQPAITTAPTPVLHNPVLHDRRLEMERLQQALPLFLQASRQSAHALKAVRLHRTEQAPPHKDLEAIVNGLLDYFAALAIVQTGDDNTDAEMRVYCAYSFPAVVLLLGPENWPGALKTCFFTLLNPNYAEDDEEDGGARKSSVEKTEPPLPVKRCLASSLHTVAHVLGPSIATTDILPVLQEYFLRDADEAVRLNIIRGFPTFLSILPPQKRYDVFVMWSKVMHGEDCLGAKKRSATNPLVLNWRQRDYLARSLPDLLHLLPPELLHAHVWPICQQLLADSVSLVRDDALWTLPVLLKVYTPDNQQQWPQPYKKFNSKAAGMEIVQWFKDVILKLNNTNNISTGGNSNYRKSASSASEKNFSNVANFCDRQLFCRLCGTIGLSLRLNEEIRNSGKKDLAAALGETVVGLFFGGNASASSINENDDSSGAGLENLPYQKLSNAEHRHLKKILEEQLLPLALAMKDDRIRNVRVTLLKVLQIFPAEMRETPHVKAVLHTLQEEVVTWESFGGEADIMPPPAVVPTASSTGDSTAQEQQQASLKKKNSGKPNPSKKERSSGPVDVDELDGAGGNSNDEDDGASGEDDSRTGAKKKKLSSKKNHRKDPSSRKLSTASKSENSSGDDDDFDSGEEDNHKQVLDGKPASVESIPSDEGAVAVSSAADQDDEKVLEQKYAESMDSFKEQVFQPMQNVRDHSEETEENPERVNLSEIMSFDVKPLPDDGNETDKLRKHMKRSKSSRSQSGKGSSNSSNRSTSSRSGMSPKKNKKESSKTSSRRPTTIEEVVPLPPGSPHELAVSDELETQYKETDHFHAEHLAGWKTVIFDDGPIGLQLEPTADDLACRVYGFLETGSARKSGKIQLGDVIVKVNDVVVRSYDQTVELLKRGGRRAVTFRPGEVSDDYVDEGDPFASNDSSDDDDDDDRMSKKKKKSSKKKGVSTAPTAVSSANRAPAKVRKSKKRND